jgi:hypothetical protein
MAKALERSRRYLTGTPAPTGVQARGTGAYPTTQPAQWIVFYKTLGVMW